MRQFSSLLEGDGSSNPFASFSWWGIHGLVLIVALIVQRLVRLLKRYWIWRKLQKEIPTGPQDCGFWLGATPSIRKEPFMVPHKRWIKQFPNAPLIRYNQIMGNNSLLILDKDIIKEILTAPSSKDTCRFKKPTFVLPMIVGYGLVTLEGEQWARHRKIIQPAFNLSFLKQALSESVPSRVTKFLHYWIEASKAAAAASANNNELEIDVGAHLSALTLDVIGDAGFSYDTSGLQDVERYSQKVVEKGGNSTGADTADAAAEEAVELTDPLITSMMSFLKPNILRLILFVTGLGGMDPYINPATKRVRAALDSTVVGIINNAKRQLNDNDDDDKDNTTNDDDNNKQKNKKAKSLLQLLLKANSTEGGENNRLSDLELKDELKTFLLAGHETTSTWCYWACYAMAKHPDVQEKLYQDVMKHCKNSESATMTISLEEIEQMEYLTAFLDETLRMYPPVGMIVRTCCYDEKLAGYHIPKGTNLVIPIHLTHRNPKYWNNPEEFLPERWMKSSEGTTTQGSSSSSSMGMDNRAFTFLPFGAGGRNCIGYKFATIEAKLIMAHMVRALRVQIAPSQRDTKHTFTNVVTMKTKPGLKIVVKAR